MNTKPRFAFGVYKCLQFLHANLKFAGFAAVLSMTPTSIHSDFCSRVRNEARAKQFYFAKATVTNPLNNAPGTIPPQYLVYTTALMRSV